ncbi:ARD/ARD' family protein [Heterostelium album PN500]|uniref:Acireductone dioxygenase n=1 Tax=Heterostelium pallidum (strain ATCC 26659 / Pp 5 / PN500) TaxID=670386 RepID=MTND_HETP5|nr:ARD/ARD' family protein [Heterostelium album PN500]D3BH90.1 RecName: Full=Acireductone dioxygenase; AltName: Full=Acireductone dioxygenase (Fe(2+)-requiring); Short=ARD'; Short=Fe-ARD; AltName: Full=Acireductone dioxygenase (Ni(2+)-requiring); Short=ARD; Short=Ni-ARD [Heterostelium album PN500]EFA79474.1 ARD/ARD' family protein [Heterostelium album PN500]|eukprot:XP_020431595.1 ARD/ARD' family protein [Heterostelium album PN500]
MKSYYFESNEPVSVQQLNNINVLYYPMPMPDYQEKLDQICQERGYKNRDEVKLNENTENLDAKLKIFFEEHLHDDEEIRFILEGSGFFDVRDANDQWIRIRVEKGDLIIVPANMYHRFTLTETKQIHACRLFTDAPKWVPINRHQQ